MFNIDPSISTTSLDKSSMIRIRPQQPSLFFLWLDNSDARLLKSRLWELGGRDPVKNSMQTARHACWLGWLVVSLLRRSERS